MIEIELGAMSAGLIDLVRRQKARLKTKSDISISELRDEAEVRSRNADPLAAMAGRLTWNACEIELSERRQS